ncbi:hypothetical protein WEB32_00710 [Streptomyces netropsis]|uniref:TnpA family transposase n=1 Tax=Streptomyces netropsis TaxID=55404 RepID=A0A7W7LCX9_STRNE|nr:hypothetical protein [Streptomyces netropsis]MBB4887903.1 TnpA family transposase [Streptomyces netropsis]GGR52082.1 hypothetical protein GCM10010219_66370 [Streptomyces netropsis]
MLTSNRPTADRDGCGSRLLISRSRRRGSHSGGEVGTVDGLALAATFVCGHLANPDLRREIHSGLQVVEN